MWKRIIHSRIINSELQVLCVSRIFSEEKLPRNNFCDFESGSDWGVAINWRQEKLNRETFLYLFAYLEILPAPSGAKVGVVPKMRIQRKVQQKIFE